MAPEISERAQKVQASPIRKLVPIAEAAREKGRKVIHLNIGQPDIPTPDRMLDAIRRFDEKVLAYGHSAGLAEYRRALVRYYARHGIDVDSENILVTIGGSEAILFAFLATGSVGDEVIVPEPYYTNYDGFASMAGIRIVPLTTRAEDGFHLPAMEQIESRITDRTVGILFSNPGNPTGVIYTREEMEMLKSIALQRDLFLMSDEVYREFAYDGDTPTSVLHLDGIEPHAIMLDSVSKRYSACGARVGCLVSRNQSLIASLMKYAQARLCPATVEQTAAAAAIDTPDSYIDGVIAEYQRRRDICHEGVMEIPGAVCLKPKGAFYLVAKLPIDDGDEFARWMLESFHVDNETVMVAPAAGFYGTPGMGRDEVRLAYVLEEKTLRRAMRILRKGVEVYNQERGGREPTQEKTAMK
ncbi:MAG: pyridoxal phosphate-dependent aminotransferase [Candidatus Eisenbacteria sp.]|nr:pyridoxal phosphate-dependent aminotransferase [Candidatus Eisenbacteria bacterium]